MRQFLQSLFLKLVQSSSPSQEIMSSEHITAGDSKVQPIQHPVSAPWSLDLSSHDVSKLLKGFAPRDMDDRWMCNTDGPDSQGHITAHFYRSWTGDEQFQIKAKSKSGYNQGAKVFEIQWAKGNANNEMDEDEAKRMVVSLCRNLLGCQLEGVPADFMKNG